MMYNIMRTNGNVAWLVKSVRPTGKETIKAMGERIVDMQFTLPVYVDFKINDFILLDGETYKINLSPTVEKKAKRLYDYTIQFEHEFYDLAKIQIQGLDPKNGYLEPNFSVMGSADTIVGLIVENMNRHYSGWTVGVIDATDYKLFSFSSQNCLQVLNQLASDFGTEFWIDNKTIHLQKREQSSGLTFAYGQGQGLYNILRQNKTNTNIVTRLYVRGSSENLPIGYREYASNLLLPGGLTYIQDDAKVALYGLIEATQTFDIKPERIGTVTSVVAGDGNWRLFSDSSMDFDVNEYKLSDAVKITFNTGQLAGYTFTLSSYNHATKTFSINKNEEEKSFDIPSDSLRPQIGDEYVILNIQMPPVYVTNGENRLLSAGQAYYDQNSDPKFLLSYSAKCDRLFIKQNNIEVQLGNTAIINDPDMGLNIEVRIASYVRDLQDRNLYDEVEWSDTIGASELVRQYAQQQRTLKLIESSGLLNPDALRKNIFLNRLSELNGYLMLGGSKINAGFADLSTRALRADLADYALDADKWHGRQFADYLNQPVRQTDAVRFASVEADKINSANFVSGFTGAGWKVDEQGNATFDNLTVRKQFNVYELVLNKISGTNGALAVTDSVKISTVIDTGGGFDCTIETDNNTIAVPFQIDDLLRCQVWNGTSVKYYFAKVTAVGNGSFTLDKATKVGAGIPSAGDVVVRFGNLSNINRQGLIYLTASDADAPYLDVLDGVNSDNLAGKTKVRLGKLNGINDADFGALQGYGLYGENVYLKNGKFKGEVTVTGGNAQTIAGSQALANAAKNDALDVVIGNGKIRTPLLDSDEIRAVTANINYLNGLNFTFSQGTVDNLKARAINAAEIVVNGGGATVNFVNTSISTATTQAEADATAKASAAQVAAIQSAANDATAKVNALNIGGRNYMLNGGIVRNINSHSPIFLQNGNFPLNTEMAVSFDAIVVNGSNMLHVEFNGGNRSTDFAVTNQWKRYSTVMSMLDQSTLYMWLMPTFAAEDGTVIQVRNIMVVVGNKPMDYVPAPEDVASDAQTKANAAQTAAQSYAAAQAAYEREVAKAYADGIVTAEEAARIAQAATNLQNAKDDAQNKVTIALGSANGYTDTKSQQTLTAAQTYADASATSKANAAQANAISQAADTAQSKANAAQAAAELLSQQLVNNLKIGGRNLFLNSGVFVSNPSYLLQNYYLSEPVIVGEKYVMTVWGTLPPTGAWFPHYSAGNVYLETYFELIAPGVWSSVFVGKENSVNYISMYVQNSTNETSITKIKLEKGTKSTDWTPAPEDVQSAIDTAKAAANDANTAYNNLTASLKSLAYQDVVELAKLGNTVIQGGKLTNTLIDTDFLKANVINASYINSLEIVANNVQANTGTIGNWQIGNDRLYSGSESLNYIGLISGSSPEIYMKNSDQLTGEYSSLNTKGLFILSTGNYLPTSYNNPVKAVGAFKLKADSETNAAALYAGAPTSRAAFLCDGESIHTGVATFTSTVLLNGQVSVQSGDLRISNLETGSGTVGSRAVRIYTSGNNVGKLFML